jgi:hypothetical protein
LVVAIILCGADEAGRGAILGPLVVSMVGVKSSSVRKLTDIGVRDSKLLSDKKRRHLYDDIVAIASTVKVRCITPAEINEAMGNDISLNEVEAKAFSEMFNDIDGEVSLVYLDSPDVIPERFGVRFSMYSTGQPGSWVSRGQGEGGQVHPDYIRAQGRCQVSCCLCGQHNSQGHKGHRDSEAGEEIEAEDRLRLPVRRAHD